MPKSYGIFLYISVVCSIVICLPLYVNRGITYQTTLSLARYAYKTYVHFFIRYALLEPANHPMVQLSICLRMFIRAAMALAKLGSEQQLDIQSVSGLCL